MKKLCNIIFITLIFLGVGYYMTGSVMKNRSTEFAQNFNRYNILAKRAPKFTQVDYDNAQAAKGGSYTFYADSYDRYGHHHEIVFRSDDDNLNDGQLLKLDTKGSYVKGYKTIGSNDMPYKVYNIFEN